jgi:hypothetical protein
MTFMGRKHPERLQEYCEGRRKRKPAMWPKQCEYCEKFLTDNYKVRIRNFKSPISYRTRQKERIIFVFFVKIRFKLIDI